ncbi:P-loop NTPase fold protein [Rhizobium sp.]|uniref:KAP family P-loop NTPase fold protein n=1 Tax=Rhizobium sp. TaxID=391 RepID=UPI00289B7DF4
MTAEEIWRDDLLERRQDATFLQEFLVNRMGERRAAGLTGSYVLNLDAGWGFGKSFFIRRFKQQLEASRHPVVLIDAWKNDFSDDPYTNVISEIEGYFQAYLDRDKKAQPSLVKAYEAVKRNAAKIAWIAFKGTAKRATRYILDDAGDQIKEVIDQHIISTGATGRDLADAGEAHIVEVTEGIIDAFAKKRLDEFKEAKISLELFRESLGKLLAAFEEHADQKLPFFILIDELDRCRPTYAIAMLERIKHLFDADNVVFILSTDTAQLAHSINAVYGTSFDSRRYLQRFFMRSYELPSPSTAELIRSLLESYKPDVTRWQNPGKIQDAHAYLSRATTSYGFNLRETKQAFDILASLTTTWSHPFPIQIGIIFPLILGHLRREDISDLTSGWLRRVLELDQGWTVRNEYYTSRGQTLVENNSVKDMVNLLVNRLNQPLHEAMNRAYEELSSGASFPSLQAHEIISAEFEARGRRRDNGDLKSLIFSYPNLIRHAGRLSG